MIGIFGISDYMERDPYRKFVVGIAHAWFAGFLVRQGMPLWMVGLGYLGKEIIFDLARIFVGRSAKWLKRAWADRLLVADSAIDWAFTWIGAAQVTYGDPRYDYAVLAIGAAYFVAGKLFNGR